MNVDLVLMLFFVGFGFDEEFYFYLFEFMGMEDEVFRCDFVVEWFICLCDVEWWFFVGIGEYVLEIDENVLGGFGM